MRETLAVLRELRVMVGRVDQALHDVGEAVAEIAVADNREGGEPQ